MYEVKALSAATAAFFIFSASSAAFAAAPPAEATVSALVGEELAKSNNCMICHKIDTKSIGPSLQDIAAKYTEDDGAAATLEKSIKEGSKGKYGEMAMPAQKKVSDEDVKKLAEWIMTLSTDTAPTGEELMKSNNCLACHKVDTKSIGPSLQDIAAKYTEDDAAAATLEKSIQEGSKVKYGGMAMPAQKQVSDEDVKKLAEWIMTLSADTAPTGEELMKSNNCMICHKVDTKSIGPSLQDIAAKYTEDDGAAAILAKSIQEGSKGKYGGMAMPAQKKVSDEDVKKISEWIITMGEKSE